jgi:NADH-quinone oxidoreductase subunit L
MVNGIAQVTGQASAGLRLVQTGLVQNYALSVVVGVIFALGFMVLR